MGLTFNKVASTGSTGKGKSATQWKEGETYLGYLTGVKVGASRFGDMKTYVLADSDEDGNVSGGETVLITSTDLEPLLSKVKENQLVQITCLGKVGSSRRVRFEVQVAEKFL